MYPHRNTTRRSIFPIAGWLFADLLLALTIIFIATSAEGETMSKAPPTLLTKPIPSYQALDPHPLAFRLDATPSQLNEDNTIARIKDQVGQRLNVLKYKNRQVGFVLTFAGGEHGVKHAKEFNTILKSIPVFHEAVFKDYHDLDNFDSRFDLEIYFVH